MPLGPVVAAPYSCSANINPIENEREVKTRMRSPSRPMTAIRAQVCANLYFAKTTALLLVAIATVSRAGRLTIAIPWGHQAGRFAYARSHICSA